MTTQTTSAVNAMTMQRQKTIYEKKGHIAYLTINNPEKANVLDQVVIEEMGVSWKDYWEDREMRCLILTSVGDRHFSAGHNIQPPPPGTTEEQRHLQMIERFVYPPAGTVNGARVNVVNGGYEFPQIYKPVVAAINGWAAGAGLYTTLTTADIRIGCREHARFFYAFTSNLGGIGSGPAATRVMKQLNYAHAMKFLLMDEPVDAEEAVRIGLINEAVPHDQLMARAEQIAQKIASQPPIAVRFLKELLIRGQDLNQDQAWHLQWLYNHLASIHSEDAYDAAAAFREKRPRRITGKVHA